MKVLTVVSVLVLSRMAFAAVADNFIQMILEDCYSNKWTSLLSNNDNLDRIRCLQYHISRQHKAHGIENLFQIHTGESLLGLGHKLSPETKLRIKMGINQLLPKGSMDNMITVNRRRKRASRQKYYSRPGRYLFSQRFKNRNIPLDLQNAPAPIIKHPFPISEQLIDNRTRSNRKQPTKFDKPLSLEDLRNAPAPIIERRFKESESITDIRTIAGSRPRASTLLQEWRDRQKWRNQKKILRQKHTSSWE